MFNVRVASVQLYWKVMFTWLLLVMSFKVSYFVLSFFSPDVFDEL